MMTIRFPLRRWRAGAGRRSATLAGCATGPNPKDPYEKFNRQMFAFNDAVDRYALKPAATAYKTDIADVRADRREQFLRQPVGPVDRR
jgi:ABC-type transporter lipoprotein component MlaA